ncbi:MAG TPA: SOS response-associated peptidase [Steroidobacteraceae bacterium]|nr:SOS response-associated peptidase [Steroidobacteraceae bacterium]
MCGRFTLTRRDGRELAAELGVPDDAFSDYRPRYNIAPMQRHFTVTTEFENRKVVSARWGLVNRWAKDNSRASQCINAKAETVEVRPSFRDAFKKRRCVVPADGFYEWTGPKGARQPLWIHRADGKLILFAGLYEDWFPEKDKPETTFTIITCEPNAVTRPIHNRMPVILEEHAADDWMEPGEADPLSHKRLLIPAADDVLLAQPASPLANSVRNDGPELLVAT